MVDTARIETHYLGAKDSVGALLGTLGTSELEAPVAACPGWSVTDVLRHLVGTAEDASAGKLSGVPTDEYTAEQVASRRSRSVDDLLASWDQLAPTFARTMAELRIWPAAVDAVTHEHDIRHAVDRRGDRAGDAIRELSAVLATGLRDVPLRVVTPTTAYGPDDAPATLRTTDFDLFRIRMGRRSRAQLEALAWQGDPSSVLDDLCVFGPSSIDIEE